MITRTLSHHTLALAVAGALLATFTAAAANGLQPQLALEDTQIDTTANGAHGIVAGNGDVVTALRVDVTAHGDQAAALMAAGAGSSITHDGGLLRSEGYQSNTAGANPLATVTANNQASIALRNVRVENLYVGGTSTQARQGLAVLANGAGITLDDSTVQAHDGVWAIEGSTLALTNTHIEALGGKALLASENSTATMQGGSILVQQAADSIGKSNSFAVGVYAVDGAHIGLTDTSIEVRHRGGEGIRSFMAGARVDMQGGSVLMTEQDAVGLRAFDAGTIAVRDSQVLATGVDAHAALVEFGALVSAANTRLVSAQSSAIRLDGAHLALTDGSQVQGGNGIAVELDSDGAGSVSMDRNALLAGDIRFGGSAYDDDGNGVVDRTLVVSLDHASTWRGATDAVDALALANGSHWELGGDSVLGSLAVANSSIGFNHDDGAFKTLTVNGNYSGDNALLLMNSVLGDDTSATDRLHVLGDTSGSTRIAVNNVGGQGAESGDGIALVQVDGRSDGQFALAGRAVGGSYEYFLHQGGVSDPSDGDWYLRSALNVDPPVDPVVDPIVDPIVDPRNGRIYRPEVGAYLANQTAAVGMFEHSMHARLGEPNLALRLGTDGLSGSAWARIGSEQSRVDLAQGQLHARTDSSVLQIGTDLAMWGTASRGVAGVMLATGKATSRTTSNITGYTASGTVDGRALGVYASWFQNPHSAQGAYVDAWAQASRFSNKVEGDAIAPERYDSKAFTGSVEAGYAFQVLRGANSAVFVEPQLQLSYTDYTMESAAHVERNGTRVAVDQAGGLQTRVGVRAYGHTTSERGNRVQPFVAVNWLRNPQAGNAMAFNDSVIAGGQPRDAYEIKGGVQLQLGGRWSGWGELGSTRGKGGYQNVGAQIGAKYAW